MSSTFPPEVREACARLESAVAVAMDPQVPQQSRMEAYTLCEQFKETSPLCAQCGLFLAQTHANAPIARHFGLQLLEHCIKYRWNAMTQPEKVFLRDSAMELLGSGTQHLLVEPAHIKDALSRIVVEMAKREWPQQWPTLLGDLAAMCGRGETQAELVLLVFLRLVEDVAVLQTIQSNQRRKDIYQALNANMGEIFGLFVRLLQTHRELYFRKMGEGCREEALAHCQVSCASLRTLCAFVEWVPLAHVVCNGGELLVSLVGLLGDPGLQGPAAECLQMAVSRKGRTEERRPLLALFDQGVMAAMFEAARQAAAHTPLDEQHYLFLKRLTQVLTGLGAQLCALWGKEEGMGQPPNFALYLKAMLAFTRHPSLQIAAFANGMWATFFKHELVSQDPVLLGMIPEWMECTSPKLVKAGYPSRSDSESCAYSRLDFESDEDFSAFFHKTRTDILDTFRQATHLLPALTYAYAERRLLAQLDFDPGNNPPNSWYQEWDGLSMLLDSVTGRILGSPNPSKPRCEQGLATLRRCLAYQTSDPIALSSLLSCISALFVFLAMAPDRSQLAPVLEKVFGALVFALPGQCAKESRGRAVRNVRRHAASLMVKAAQKYPLLLLPAFDWLRDTVRRLADDPRQLSKLEKVTLQESLLLVSNHFYDYGRQSEFAGQVVGLAAPHWAQISPHFESPQAFMAFVGLDRPPVEPSSEDVNGQGRSHLLFCLDLFLAVVKRCAAPDDPERASRGGFLAGRTQAGNPVCRNPAAPHIAPLIPQVLCLAGVLNQLWTPPAVSRLSEGYSRAHAMLDLERDNLLGRSGPGASSSSHTPSTGENPSSTHDGGVPTRMQTPLERMQHFLSQLHDNCHHLLGNCAVSLGRDLYRCAPGLSVMVCSTALAHLEWVPDYRLRTVLRVFVRPFLAACPPECHTDVAMPVLAHLCPYMLTRMDARWNDLHQLYERSGEEDSDAQEVVEDMVSRQVTREYLDVLRAVLVGGGPGGGPMGGPGGGPMSGPGAQSEAMEEDCPRPHPASTHEAISELGAAALRAETTCQPITLFLLRALSWQDTVSCLRAASLCGPLIRQLAQDGSLDAQVSSCVMLSVLRGLHVHGEHEANQASLVSLGASAYECLRPTFPCVADVLKMMPNCDLGDLAKLDEKVSQPVGGASTAKVDKAKKDLFKKLTSQLVGCNVGQLFKKEVHIQDLPPLRVGGSHRPKQTPLLDQGQSAQPTSSPGAAQGQGPGEQGGADHSGLQTLFQQ